uniref:Serine/arginine repetitive matrix protein 1-like n=1 Tax=Crassostrea virginica TaxID=6565 RepID=A0A8B8AUN1_CRAVI|nr:serine/arginine repetitive matrix protein 1-like [Crassostrea virginica]
MVGDVQSQEFLLGYSPDGQFEIIARPVRGPVRAYRPRSPPPPPPQPPQPPTSAQSSASAASGPLPQRPPSPQRPPPPPRPQTPQQQIWIPVSDGTYALANGSTIVRRGYTGSIKITSDEKGKRVVKEERLDPGFETRMAALERSFARVREKKSAPPPRPPPPKTTPAPTSTEEEGVWLTTRSRPLTSTPRRPPRWVSPPPQRPRTPPPQRPRSPPPPYQGIVVTEVPQRPQSPPPPYGEVSVERSGDAVRVVSRAVVPSAPPRDEGYGSGSSSSTGSRGTVRPHSVSPFLRSIRRRLEDEGNEEEDIDLEAISCLLDFSTRERGGARPQTPSQSVVTVSSFKIDGTSGTEGSSVMVRTFATSPPHNTSRRSPPRQTSCHFGSTSFRAFSETKTFAKKCPRGGGGAEAHEAQLPLITASSPIIIPLESDEEYFSELEYVDPYEEEGPFSSTPPPSCDQRKEHKICVPPAWGEEIPGSVVRCRCLLCHQEDMHHAIRCLQCEEAEEGEEEVEEEKEERRAVPYCVGLAAAPGEVEPPKRKKKKKEEKKIVDEEEGEEEEGEGRPPRKMRQRNRREDRREKSPP